MLSRLRWLFLFMLVEMLLFNDARAEDIRPEPEPPAPTAKQAHFQGKPVNYWVKKLEDSHRTARMDALTALDAIGPDAETAIPELAKALGDEDLEVAKRAIQVLGTTKSKLAVPHLTEAMKDKDWNYQECAAKALGETGEAAVPALLAALKDKNVEYRKAAIMALGLTRVSDKAVVSVLIHEIQHTDDSSVVDRACTALKRIGPDAVKAHTADLLGAMKNANPEIRRWLTSDVMDALTVMGSEAVPILVGFLKDENVELDNCGGSTRSSAAYYLGIIGPAAKEAKPALTQALEDKDEYVRIRVKEALEKINKQ